MALLFGRCHMILLDPFKKNLRQSNSLLMAELLLVELLIFLLHLLLGLNQLASWMKVNLLSLRSVHQMLLAQKLHQSLNGLSPNLINQKSSEEEPSLWESTKRTKLLLLLEEVPLSSRSMVLLDKLKVKNKLISGLKTVILCLLKMEVLSLAVFNLMHHQPAAKLLMDALGSKVLWWRLMTNTIFNGKKPLETTLEELTSSLDSAKVLGHGSIMNAGVWLQFTLQKVIQVDMLCNVEPVLRAVKLSTLETSGRLSYRENHVLLIQDLSGDPCW